MLSLVDVVQAEPTLRRTGQLPESSRARRSRDRGTSLDRSLIRYFINAILDLLSRVKIANARGRRDEELAGQLRMGGQRCTHGRASSNCPASRNSVASSPKRPANCVPIGSPSLFQ